MAFNHQILRNSRFEIQTALGSDIPITGVSNATEAVFTATNTLAQGDLVVLDGIAGMERLNKQVVRVKSATTTQFTAEQLDTTSTQYWGTYLSGGKANKVSTMAAFTNISGLDLPDATPDEIDVTTIDSDSRQIVYGHDGILKGSASLFADPVQDAVKEVRQASRFRTARVFRLTTQGGTVWIWNATNLSGGAGFSGSVSQAATATINMTLPAVAQAFAS